MVVSCGFPGASAQSPRARLLPNMHDARRRGSRHAYPEDRSQEKGACRKHVGEAVTGLCGHPWGGVNCRGQAPGPRGGIGVSPARDRGVTRHPTAAGERRLEEIADLAPAPIYLLDLRAPRLVYANRAFERYAGCALDVLAAKGEDALRTALGLPRELAWSDHAAQVEAAGPGTLQREIRLTDARGERLLVTREAIFDRRPDGTAAHIVGFAEDAADLRQIRTERDAANGRVETALLQTIEALSRTLEKRDPYTAGHQQRVAELAVAMAAELGWDAGACEALRLGALIHDIGKIMVPAEILNRPGHLSANEQAIIRTHPTVGGEILEGVDFPWPLREMVLQHHERLDGSGYPLGLEGDAIIPEARVLAVADVVEAMASHRPYRPTLGRARAIAELRRESGACFDPTVVEAACEVLARGDIDWL